MDEWHVVLGHPQRRIVSSLIKQFHLPCSSNSSSLCSSCILGKHARLSLGSVQHKSTAPFQLIYFDVWVRQLDISNAFLLSFIDSDVYMEQPIGFQDSSHLDYVCKLSKSLYGFKQASRA